VGATLDEIHSRRLYKPKYKNFKTYLQERWGISRAHGYRLMAAAKVAEMSPTGDKPANEHQARKRNAKTKVTAARSETASKVIIDLDAEFKTFTELVSRWEKGLAKEDSRRLLQRVERWFPEEPIHDRARREKRIDSVSQGASQIAGGRARRPTLQNRDCWAGLICRERPEAARWSRREHGQPCGAVPKRASRP
jgi:hypothetical protein